ncbi:hypothetical protein JRQ81_020014 [Phrynocephalus forsythii]|uniref:Methyltransferase small domain-containing protein n=1 Tax=Phrynocephalus forsythii TaxID=171643 RepID=A0A9Q0XNQ4_9SAUR|nr:hypothetical protein JRQ81_020014 [Phrynocephalus forsythii]
MMIPTPWHQHVSPEGPFSDVYEPAEDTFLLLDGLEGDAEALKGARVDICLEVGCGSGVVSAFLASIFGPTPLYLCTDINPVAGLCTVETANRNKVDLQPIITNLTSRKREPLSTQIFQVLKMAVLANCLAYQGRGAIGTVSL